MDLEIFYGHMIISFRIKVFFVWFHLFIFSVSTFLLFCKYVRHLLEIGDKKQMKAADLMEKK